MSIIQEALKKAQETYLKRTTDKKEPAQELPRDNIVTARSDRKVPPHHTTAPLPIVIAAIVIIAVLAVFGLRSFFSAGPEAGLKEPASRQEVSLKQVPETSSISKSSSGIQGILPSVDDVTSPLRRTLSSTFMADRTVPELVLNGIMYLQEGPKAIINSTVVREGDVVSGATVKVINRNNVLLNFNDSEITLTLNE